VQLSPGAEFVDASDRHLRLRVANPEQTNAGVLRDLLMAGAPLVMMDEAPRTLEQVYLSVMAAARGSARVQ
jgi:hypothetical protein